MIDFLTQVINPIAWVIGNLLIAYIAIAVTIFVVAYYVLFDPKATTAGRLIFRFFLSLIGIILLVFIGIYIDPAGDRSWLEVSPMVDAWRPLVRVVVYTYVAFTITSLAVLLARRKWWSHQLTTAPNSELVKVRHETHEIPIVKNN